MRTRFRTLTLLGAALMISGPLAFAADAAAVKTYTRTATYHVQTGLTIRGCGNQLSMDISSGVTLATENYSFFFSNNAKLTHVADTSGDLSAVFYSNDGQGLTLEANARGKTLPVGGNPWVFLYYEDSDGHGQLLGGMKCRQIMGMPGSSWISQTDLVEQLIDTVGVLSCQNHPGPYVDIAAGTDGPGVSATILVTNNKNKASTWMDYVNGGDLANGFHVADADGYVTLEPTNGRITVRKGGRLGTDDWGNPSWGPGGNPHIWAFPTSTLEGPDGDRPTLTVGDDAYVGRCKDL